MWNLRVFFCLPDKATEGGSGSGSSSQRYLSGSASKCHGSPTLIKRLHLKYLGSGSNQFQNVFSAPNPIKSFGSTTLDLHFRWSWRYYSFTARLPLVDRLVGTVPSSCFKATRMLTLPTWRRVTLMTFQTFSLSAMKWWASPPIRLPRKYSNRSRM